MRDSRRLSATATWVGLWLQALCFTWVACPFFARALAAAEPSETKVSLKKGEWVDLFDGKSLKNWKITPFGGEGTVEVEEGKLILGLGFSLTGVTYEGPTPKYGYEIRLEGMRVDGTDFFAGLTFPVGDSSCTFIVGGWGGGVIGLSSIDGLDAAENETTTYMPLENGRWYRLRVRVTEERIQAWVDDEKKVDQDIRGRKISVRSEVELAQPLGISAWETRGAIRKVQIRLLEDEEPRNP